MKLEHFNNKRHALQTAQFKWCNWNWLFAYYYCCCCIISVTRLGNYWLIYLQLLNRQKWVEQTKSDQQNQQILKKIKLFKVIKLNNNLITKVINNYIMLLMLSSLYRHNVFKILYYITYMNIQVRDAPDCWFAWNNFWGIISLFTVNNVKLINCSQPNIL